MSYAELGEGGGTGREKGVFVVRPGGGIDLPSSWPTLRHCIVSHPHSHTLAQTHALVPKALPPFFFFSFPSFSPTLSQINLSASPSYGLMPPSQIKTHTHIHCNCNQIKYSPPFSALPDVYSHVYNGRVSKGDLQGRFRQNCQRIH